MKINYASMVTPDSSGKCPKGMEVCPGVTTLEWQMCLTVPDGQDKDTYLAQNCPITALHFLASTDPEQKDFTYITIKNFVYYNYKLGISRTVDSMPLSNFQLQ